MAQPITDEQWAEIDCLIVTNRILDAIKAIKDRTASDLNAASLVFYERYAQLRAAAPERFTCSNRDYWRGFYTNGRQPPLAEPGTMLDWIDL